MRDNRLQLQKEEAIKSEYARLAGERKYCREYIIDKIAQQFYLKFNTVERIVWGEYDTNRKRKEAQATAA